jgi:hypothetical protein
MPNFAGVTPNCAVSAASRTSQATASWQPPPMQAPRIAATVGYGNDASAASAAMLVS